MNPEDKPLNNFNKQQETKNKTNSKQSILVFQQNGSAETKIKGVKEYGNDCFDIQVISIDMPLPDVIDDSSDILPQDFSTDLVLDYLKHTDLSHDLGIICRNKKIPIIASGKKSRDKWVSTPRTCCGLSRQDRLGKYGEKFGLPEFEVEITDGKIDCVNILRGAPCGATWKAAAGMKGLSLDDAILRMGLETQFFCTGNPAGWDPIYGKSPVHFAGEVHSSALKRAIKKIQDKE